MADDPETEPSPRPRQASGLSPAQSGQYGDAPPHTILYARQGNGIGVAAGVCGIIAVALCWIPFVDYVSIVLGTLAIVLGTLGVRRANANEGSGKGMAVTGIICGIVGLAIALIFLLLIYAVISTVTSIG